MTLIQKGNAKLNNTYMFNLPAIKEVCGRECPRCYAIAEQIRYPSALKVRQFRWIASARSNFCDKIHYELAQLKERPKYFRIHASGEFYSQDYINSWVKIAEANPFIIFYSYTKRLRHFDFSKFKALKNTVLIDSLHFDKLNYGSEDEAPKNAPICPVSKDIRCGIECTYCMTKVAEEKGIWFIKH